MVLDQGQYINYRSGAMALGMTQVKFRRMNRHPLPACSFLIQVIPKPFYAGLALT